MEGELIASFRSPKPRRFAEKEARFFEAGLISKTDHAARACRRAWRELNRLNGLRDEALLSEDLQPGRHRDDVLLERVPADPRVFKKDVTRVDDPIRQSG